MPPPERNLVPVSVDKLTVTAKVLVVVNDPLLCGMADKGMYPKRCTLLST